MLQINLRFVPAKTAIFTCLVDPMSFHAVTYYKYVSVQIYFKVFLNIFPDNLPCQTCQDTFSILTEG